PVLSIRRASTPRSSLSLHDALPISGEMRVSNFLLWQSAYSEYYATPTLWPDFGREDLREALNSYHQRQRRFGRIPAPPTTVAQRSEEHTSELQSHLNLVCSLLLEKK